MRICTFPFKYTDSKGEEQTIYIDESDYTKYISGEKPLEELLEHKIDKPQLLEILQYEHCKGKKLLD